MFEGIHTSQISLPEPASDLIRRAEQMIASGHFADAITLLDQAHLRQPDNQYILAIRQRAELLHHSPSSRNGSERLTDSGSSRQGVTESPAGMIPEPQRASELEGTNTHVQRLTLVAGILFKRGELDSAFESLMKAYFIDPNNPRVIACEKTMRPLWDLMRTRGVLGSPRIPVAEATTSQKARSSAPETSSSDVTVDLDRELRLRNILERKEQERKERERAMWRNASNPPRTSPEKPADARLSRTSNPFEEASHGLFWRLRIGRIHS